MNEDKKAVKQKVIKVKILSLHCNNYNWIMNA